MSGTYPLWLKYPQVFLEIRHLNIKCRLSFTAGNVPVFSLNDVWTFFFFNFTFVFVSPSAVSWGCYANYTLHNHLYIDPDSSIFNIWFFLLLARWKLWRNLTCNRLNPYTRLQKKRSAYSTRVIIVQMYYLNSYYCCDIIKLQ